MPTKRESMKLTRNEKIVLAVVLAGMVAACVFGCSLHIMGKYYQCEPEPAITVTIPENDDVEED